VTRGAVGVGGVGVGGVVDLAGSVVWGMVRTAQTEHPGRFVLVDLDPDGDPDWVGLCRVLVGSVEPELVVRGGVVLVPRLVRAGGRIAGVGGFGAGVDWRVDVTGGGTLDGVGRVPDTAAGRRLGPGEVRIAVRAAGLNFHDVVVALDMVGDDGGLGGEGAGVVVEVGAGVRGFGVGDRVLGAFSGAFAARAVADARMLARVPAGWSFMQAAAVPAVFLTAYYALVELAGLDPRPGGCTGRSVLVHSAAGGVGMAAVQLARAWGATVYATASAGKWDAVAGLGVPAQQIASSRDTRFAEVFRAHTGGRGVDVVLGSLAGAAVDASLRLVAAGGRYLEMGKTDIRAAQSVAAQYPGVVYRAFDLAEAGPQRIGQMLEEILRLFGCGALRLPPITGWELAELPAALRYLSQGRHIGKNVVRIPVPVDPEGTVLITGGTGTLGGLVAEHLLARHGIRHLLLLSRRGPAAPGAEQLRDTLTAAGATVTITACDTSDRDQLAAAIAAVPPAHPLTAVIHAAGTLDDAALTSMTPTQLHRVLTSKLNSAVHLHHLLQDQELAGLVLFSSGGGILGSGGQANYTAANTFLDTLAHHLRHLGQPATSIAWGLWQQTSTMTAHLTDTDRARMARSAVTSLTDEQGLALLDAATGSGHPLLLAAGLNRANIPDHPIWTHLAPASARPAAATGSDAGSLAVQLAGQNAAQRHHTLLTLVRGHTAAVLAQPSGDTVDPHRGFLDQGLDSLTAVELRNRLSTATTLRLPPTTVFDHPTPQALAAHLVQQFAADAGAAGEESTGDRTEADIRRALARLSLAQLRDAGLMTPLLRLAGVDLDDAVDGATDAAGAAGDADRIDRMDIDDLVQVALGGTS
jgi:NADPH:quinone reductase-like Zn-dependent oxidoreductase/NADP-dependent 3-hydroxy acid dehydrogenase YdfG